MNESDNNDRLDKLNDSLYSPNSPEVNKIFKRGILDGQDGRAEEIRREWKPVEKPRVTEKLFGWTKHEQPIFRKILWFALGFFILCLALASYLYIHGTNTISPKKIDISIAAPQSISASNPFAMDISVTNSNNASLSSVDLLVDYPDGSRTVEDNTKPMVNDLIPIGAINKGEIIKKRSEAVLFGQEGDKETIHITLEYKVPGSSEVFKKETDYDVTISSAPVTVSVDSVKELNSDQQISFDVKVTSNSANVLKNVAIQPTFPFGFTYGSSDPALASSSTFSTASYWLIDELAPTESKEFTLKGKLSGLKAEDKDFKFIVGSLDPTDSSKIGTQYVTVDRLITIQSPFVSSTIAFGAGAISDASALSAGNIARGVISYQNNLTTDINDLEFTLKLNDNGLIDKSRIQVTDGFYSSLTNTITWNKQTKDSFTEIHPGDSGQLLFSLPFIKPTDTALKTGTYKNQIANFDLTIHGQRLSDANVPEQITLLNSKSVKIGTEVDITPTIAYTIGPFTNTGGIPPRVNNPTTYTVTLSLADTFNDVQNGVVTATLPPYVAFGDAISPTTENLTFNKNINQVQWNVGTIFGGQGYKSGARQVSFKIILTPSANQVNSIPVLVDQIHFSGVDAFTSQSLTSDGHSLSTELDDDPGFKNGQGRVSN